MTHTDDSYCMSHTESVLQMSNRNVIRRSFDKCHILLLIIIILLCKLISDIQNKNSQRQNLVNHKIEQGRILHNM